MVLDWSSNVHTHILQRMFFHDIEVVSAVDMDSIVEHVVLCAPALIGVGHIPYLSITSS